MDLSFRCLVDLHLLNIFFTLEADLMPGTQGHAMV